MEILSPTSRFSNVDFPAFGRPTIETNPDFLADSCADGCS
jgi:hypothetical protein